MSLPSYVYHVKLGYIFRIRKRAIEKLNYTVDLDTLNYTIG